MALKPCKECRKEISDSAKVCPHCGFPNPGDYGLGKLIIHRRTTWPGILSPLHISINGVEIGELKVEESMERELESGEYTMQCWEASWYKSTPFRVKIWGGHVTKVETYVGAGFPLNSPKIEYAQN